MHISAHGLESWLFKTKFKTTNMHIRAHGLESYSKRNLKLLRESSLIQSQTSYTIFILFHEFLKYKIGKY